MIVKKIWLFLGVPLAVGGLAALLAGGMGTYDNFAQPPLSPPGWVFPVVWTILYLAMGYASWRVYTKEENVRQRWFGLGVS
jgi:tryptophan-rich sensory protein